MWAQPYYIIEKKDGNQGQIWTCHILISLHSCFNFSIIPSISWRNYIIFFSLFCWIKNSNQLQVSKNKSSVVKQCLDFMKTILPIGAMKLLVPHHTSALMWSGPHEAAKDVGSVHAPLGETCMLPYLIKSRFTYI